MNRRTKSRRRLCRGGAAAALAVCLLTPALASATPPASDEYRLDLHGAHVNSTLGIGPTGELDLSGNGVQAGVAGESETQPSLLSSAGAAIVAAPIAVLAALIGLGWLGAARLHSPET